MRRQDQAPASLSPSEEPVTPEAISLVVDTQPSDEDVNLLEAQLTEFNFKQTGIQDGELLALFMRNAQNEIRAGLYGWTWGGCCEIRYLWVHADLRGQGYGRLLLTVAEQTALERGCTQIVLDTHSFQAPGFYQKHGYEIVAVIDDYPRGHQKIFLRKPLTARSTLKRQPPAASQEATPATATTVAPPSTIEMPPVATVAAPPAAGEAPATLPSGTATPSAGAVTPPAVIETPGSTQVIAPPAVEAAPAHTGPLRFLALGDSYTIGESVRPAERWPVQLAQLLRADGTNIQDPVIIARTGWTTDELWTGMDRAEPQGPFDLVSLLIGVNNQYRGRELPEYRWQFVQLVRRAMGLAGDRPERVLVLSIPDWGVTPFAQGRDRALIGKQIDRFNAINREEALRLEVNYVDVTPSSRQAIADAALIAADGLHPSGQLYAEWAQLALPVVRAVLGVSVR